MGGNGGLRKPGAQEDLARAHADFQRMILFGEVALRLLQPVEDVAAYRVELVKVGKPRADAIEDDETAPGLERPTALTAEERARMVAYADQAMIELIRAGEAPEQVPDLAWLMAGQMIRNGRAMT